MLNVCLTQGGIAIPFRRSPKPGPLSQGNLRKRREEKADDFKPPEIGLQRPPEMRATAPSVDFEEVFAEEVSPSTPLNTTPGALPSTVS